MNIATAKSRHGGLYQAYIVSKQTEKGFEAVVERVILLRPPKALGTEIHHDPFPVHTAESKERAELMATMHFKACAKLGTLGL